MSLRIFKEIITTPTGQHWPWQYGARVAWATFAPSPATLAPWKELHWTNSLYCLRGITSFKISWDL